MSNKTFMALAVAGEFAKPEVSIRGFVAAWHEGKTKSGELHEWLGMTWNEYAAWADDSSVLKKIIASRRKAAPSTRARHVTPTPLRRSAR